MVRWLLVLVLVATGVVAISTTSRATVVPSLTALDVGQGDSLYLNGEVPLLVDTGGRGQNAQDKARQFGERPQALIITHLHEDHAGDVLAVLRTKPVAVFWNGRKDGQLFSGIETEAKKLGIPLVPLVPGDLLHAGTIKLTVLAPTAAYRTSADLNDTSLVLRADFPGFSALLTGDTNTEGELQLPLAAVDVDVLKVGHHGSKTSTGDSLLDAATPEIGLISAGKGNRYKHPTKEALTRLAAHHVRVYRTDQEGNVTVRKVGGTLVVSTSSVH